MALISKSYCDLEVTALRPTDLVDQHYMCIHALEVFCTTICEFVEFIVTSSVWGERLKFIVMRTIIILYIKIKSHRYRLGDKRDRFLVIL